MNANEFYASTVEDKIKREIKEEIERVRQFLKEVIPNSGLVPEVGERKKESISDVRDGYNSELTGYSLRFVIAEDDRETFDKIHQSLTVLRMPSGLLKARLNADRTQDGTVGLSWPDANQDVALALIEAGERWNTDQFLEQGITLANTFLNSEYVKELANGDLIILNIPQSLTTSRFGERVDFIDLSMINFKLNKKLQHYAPNEKWQRLSESGQRIIGVCMDHYELLPDKVLLADGEVFPIRNLATSDALLDSIPVDEVRDYLAGDFIPEWNWDSCRIPYRLSEVHESWADEINGVLFERLEKAGGSSSHMNAVSGMALSHGEHFAATIAPLLLTVARLKGVEEALATLEKNKRPADDQVLYMQLWRGLALQRLLEGV